MGKHYGLKGIKKQQRWLTAQWFHLSQEPRQGGQTLLLLRAFRV